MDGFRRTELALLFLALSAALAVGCPPLHGPPPAPSRIPLAILGESDSHAYQDRITFPEGGGERGGDQRALSLQWTEILARLRAKEIDPGQWGEWGVPGRWTRLVGWFGGDRRSPRKQDHEFNFAWSGARCADLLEGPGRQAPRLAARIAEHPHAWRGGIVVVRIGINDLGTREALDAFVAGEDSEENHRRVDACLSAIDLVLRQLVDVQPELRVLLVGVLDNVDWPRRSGDYADPEARRRIAAMLDRFDDGLRALAANSPNRAFFDDRAFYRHLVGGRAEDGAPAYRRVPVRHADGTIAWWVDFAEGDDPGNLYLADGHAGTVLNAHWAQALAAVMKGEFDAPITPILDAERDAFLIELSDAKH